MLAEAVPCYLKTFWASNEYRRGARLCRSRCICCDSTRGGQGSGFWKGILVAFCKVRSLALVAMTFWRLRGGDYYYGAMEGGGKVHER